VDLLELKTRMGLSLEDTSDDKKLLLDLMDGIDYAQEYCKQSFKTPSGVLDLPPGVKRGIVLLIKSMKENSNVQSQRLGDMEKTFFQNGTLSTAQTFFNPYRKVRFF